MRELRESIVMGQMVQSLGSPQVDGREQLMPRSESPAMVGGHPLAHLPVGLNPSPATSSLWDHRHVPQPLGGSDASSAHGDRSAFLEACCED